MEKIISVSNSVKTSMIYIYTVKICITSNPLHNLWNNLCQICLSDYWT